MSPNAGNLLTFNETEYEVLLVAGKMGKQWDDGIDVIGSYPQPET